MQDKMYTKEEVTNVISFMAQMGEGIISDVDHAEELFNKIPEDLQQEVFASLLSARIVKKMITKRKLSSIFPLER